MEETMEKYRILQIHNFYQIPGGEDVVVRNEKKLLEEHGHEVFTYYRSNKDAHKQSSLPVYPVKNKKTKVFLLMSRWKRLLNIVLIMD